MASLLALGKGSGPVYFRSRSAADPLRPSVCDTCRNWTLDMKVAEGQTRELKVDFYDIAESAYLEECPYCYAIHQSIMAVGGEINLEGYCLISLSAEEGDPFYVMWDDKVDGRSCAEVYRSRDSPEGSQKAFPLAQLGYANAIVNNPSSDALFSQAEEWIEDCIRSHRGCKQTSGGIPSRVVYVGKSDADSIRLVQNVPEDTKYLALSHCWGTNRCRTVRDNLPDRLEHIPWDELPQTFKDAILAARHFGIEYVWIDSLCIIQDDNSDWATESARMGMIYEGAYTTIAAASASDDYDGFLHEFEGRKRHISHKISLFPFGPDFEIMARLVHDTRTLKSTDPLNLRGWTFQERLLPTRILTYSSSSVTFECRTSTYCECGSGLRPDPFLDNVKHRGELLLNRFEETNREVLQELNYGMTRANMHDAWYFQIVLPFTSRKLTRESDRIPAISAIAQKFQQVLSDKYLAGLWWGDVARGLLWTSFSAPGMSKCNTSPTSQYRAPSWSWASIEGKLSYDFPYFGEPSYNHERVCKIKVHEAECFNTVPRILFGEVSAGYIRVSGQVWVGNLEITSTGGVWGASLFRETKDSRFASYSIETRAIFDTYLVEQPLPGSEDGRTVSRAHGASGWSAINAPVITLNVYETHRNGGVGPIGLSRRFMILLAKVTADQEVYQRLGVINDASSPYSWFSYKPEEKEIVII